MPPDHHEGFVPAAGHITIALGIVAHRFRETSLHFQPVVRLFHEFGDGVFLEELPRDAELRCLVGQRLGAVLAKFERLLTVGIRKGAAGALEAARLVHRQKRARALGDDALLHKHFRRCGGSAPAAGRVVVAFVLRLSIGHGQHSRM